MSASLTPADRAKLSAILGRLGSDHAGERDSAALAACRFIRAKGTTWPEVLAGKTQAEALSDYIVERMRARAEREAKRAANANDPAAKRRRNRQRALREWKSNADALRWNRRLTDEERTWFESIDDSTARKSGDDAIALQHLFWRVISRDAGQGGTP
jgi:hypothetical protein